MFPNKNLVGNLSKLSKYKLESWQDGLFYYLGVKTSPRLNSPNISILTPAESNGFQGGISPRRRLIEVQNNPRWLSQDVKCWSCQKPLEVQNFACVSCGALQHPKPNVNFFQLLGISQMFEVDIEDLSRKFRNLQMIFHPDKFANKSKEELNISETYSRLLNKAYSTLKDPLARGFYLLELQNISPDSCPLQQDFLKTVMEKYEELESIDKPNILSQFMDNNNDAIETQLRLVKEAFRGNQMDNAKTNLLKLKYYMNLDNKIKEKQSSLTPDNNI